MEIIKRTGTHVPGMKFLHLQPLKHYTGETTLDKLNGVMSEKEKCNHKAPSRLHMC